MHFCRSVVGALVSHQPFLNHRRDQDTALVVEETSGEPVTAARCRSVLIEQEPLVSVDRSVEPVSYTHLTLPTTPYV